MSPHFLNIARRLWAALGRAPGSKFPGVLTFAFFGGLYKKMAAKQILKKMVNKKSILRNTQ